MHNLKAKVLLPKEDTTLTKVIKKSVLDDLAGRYESENQFLSMCTFLDPRFKMEYTCNKEELKKVKESVLQLVQEEIQENRAIKYLSLIVQKPALTNLHLRIGNLLFSLRKQAIVQLQVFHLKRRSKTKLILTCLHQLSISKMTSLLYYGGKNMLVPFLPWQS